MTTLTAPKPLRTNSLTAGKLPKVAPWLLLVLSWIAVGAVFGIMQASGATAKFNMVGTIFFGALLYAVLISVISRIVEGRRRAVDRLVTALVTCAFLLALLPLISLAWTTVSNGAARFDAAYFNESMRNVIGVGGGGLHAIVGTVEITIAAAIISIPVGLFTSIYLVEYGRGPIARAITFLVDVMTGIPSIVAGLFAYALFTLIFGPGSQSGIGGAIALSLLMVPVVVRSSEEMLRLVPNDLREASYALGVPKWQTILRIVLPTAMAGIVTGFTLAISRVIGETAPLLVVAGYTTSMNYDIFKGPMMTLPVFVYNQYAHKGVPASAFDERAWTGALTLILIVMALNLVARLIARIFTPKFSR
jgi:phosphate transport system permease protein